MLLGGRDVYRETKIIIFVSRGRCDRDGLGLSCAATATISPARSSGLTAAVEILLLDGECDDDFLVDGGGRCVGFMAVQDFLCSIAEGRVDDDIRGVVARVWALRLALETVDVEVRAVGAKWTIATVEVWALVWNRMRQFPLLLAVAARQRHDPLLHADIVPVVVHACLAITSFRT